MTHHIEGWRAKAWCLVWSWSVLVQSGSFLFYGFGYFVFDSVWFAMIRSNEFAAFDSQYQQYTMWRLTDSFDKSFVICICSRDDKFICEKCNMQCTMYPCISIFTHQIGMSNAEINQKLLRTRYLNL